MTRAAAEVAPPPPAARRGGLLELGGYALFAVALLALLWSRLHNVDGFYLDEWMYTHGAETMWQHPGAITGPIANWTRGPQRLYSLLLAPLWGTLGASAAYTLSHVLNALLLVSAIVPAALLARRVIDAPPLRVLAAALATGVPWLVIGSNLLTENLAFPLLMWSVYLTVRAATTPTLVWQLLALAAVGALALTRLNLAVMFGVLVVAVVVAELLGLREERGLGVRARLGGLVRRRWPILIAIVLAVVAAAKLKSSAGTDLGSYGAFTGKGFLSGKWAQRDAILTMCLTYLRALVTGGFVFGFVLGVGGALAAVRGVLGPRGRVAGLVALLSVPAVIGVVAIWTTGAVYEERYVFYVYAPLAVFAVAAVPHLRRILPELLAASALAVWALERGAPFPNGNSANYFAAPAAAFWSRVLEYRLLSADRDHLGGLLGTPSNWHVVALALVVLLVVVLLFRVVPRARALRLDVLAAGGLVLCLAAQLLILNYDFGKLLYGTPEAPGGLAGGPGHAADRDRYVDDALPAGASAVIVPPAITPATGVGTPERVEFWNRRIDGVVSLTFTGAGVPAAAGYDIVTSTLAANQATWQGRAYRYAVEQLDDPRVQFAGTRAGTSRYSPSFIVTKLAQPPAAVWTGTGLETDLYLLAGHSSVLTLERERARDVHAVTLRLRGADGAPGKLTWRVAGPGKQVQTGSLRQLNIRSTRLRVPPCPASGACPPVSWTLTASGKPASLSLPGYGAPPPPRPVTVQLLSAHLEHGG